MNLPQCTPRRISIPATPLADLALLLVLAVAVAAMESTARGVGLRFASAAEAPSGSPDAGTALIVAVGADGGVRVDGTPVPHASLAGAVRERVASRPETTVLLVVASAASYQAAVDAASPLLRPGVLGERPLSIPTERQVELLRQSPAFAAKLP